MNAARAVLFSISALGILLLAAILFLEVVALRDRRRRSRQMPTESSGGYVLLGSFAAKLEHAQIDRVNGESIVFLKLCVPTESIESLHKGASILIAEEVAVALFTSRKDGDDEPTG